MNVSNTMNKPLLFGALLGALALSSAATASAQYSDQYRRASATPERFAFEFGVG